MEKKLTPQEIEEQALADKIAPLIKELTKERFALDLKRGNGVTLEKNEYIGQRTAEIEAELSKLKTKDAE